MQCMPEIVRNSSGGYQKLAVGAALAAMGLLLFRINRGQGRSYRKSCT